MTRTFTTQVHGTHRPTMSPAAAAAIASAAWVPARWTLFWRSESNRRAKGQMTVKVADVVLPANTHPADVYAHAVSTRAMPVGSARCGCFEMQNDLGIFSQVNDSRMSFTTARRAAKVVFKTWAELDAEEQE